MCACEFVTEFTVYLIKILNLNVVFFSLIDKPVTCMPIKEPHLHFSEARTCFKCCVDSQLVEAILHMQVVKAYLTTITLLITILSSS